MAKPCPSNDPITQAEASCYLGKNPGTLDFYQKNGWSIAESNYVQIACDARFGAGASDPRYSGKTFGEYLVSVGCRQSGGGSDGGSDAPPIDGLLEQISAWVLANPLPSVMLAVGGAWLLLRSRR